MFIGLCFDQEKVSTPLQVGSFQKETSVTSAAVFNSIIETTDKPLLSRVYSIMADTTAVNTGKKSGVNKRLEEYFQVQHWTPNSLPRMPISYQRNLFYIR